MVYSKNMLKPLIMLLFSTNLLCQYFKLPDYTLLDQSLTAEYGHMFGFSVVIGNENEIIFKRSYGYSDSLKTKLTDDNTLFNIASVSKSFTAIGIFKLIEQGRLKLSDTIGKLLPQVPEDKLTITISNLLSHTSGFQQNYVCDGIKNSSKALNALLADTLGSIPGTKFDYSNENYEMLAQIIEAVTHTSYEHFITDQILDPLHLTNTIFWDEAINRKNIADKNEHIEDSLLHRNWGYIGSGGIYSTPSDLHTFMYAVSSNKLVTLNSTQQMFSTHLTTNNCLGIGYGWFINEDTDLHTKEIWTRGNEDWGHNAVIRWFPSKKIIIIVCTNSGEIKGDKHTTGNRIVSNFIADFLWKNN